MKAIYGIVCILSIGRFVLPYSQGNIPTSACNTMVPGHNGNNPQNSASPYIITLESVFFIANISLRVYLETTGTAPNFKGFYCQARKVDSGQIVGIFQDLISSEVGHNCLPEADSFDTISHSKVWSSSPNDTKTVRWMKIGPGEDKIKFRCTFVQQFSTFWVGVESDTIKPIRDVTVTECCNEEGLSIGCSSLCQRINKEPANLSVASDVLLKATLDNDSECEFYDAQLALRCSYWSKTAEDLDEHALAECCESINISSECSSFCSTSIYGSMDYFADDLNYCLSEHPQLSTCIIYPAMEFDDTDDDNTTPNPSPSTPASSTTFATTTKGVTVSIPTSSQPVMTSEPSTLTVATTSSTTVFVSTKTTTAPETQPSTTAAVSTITSESVTSPVTESTAVQATSPTTSTEAISDEVTTLFPQENDRAVIFQITTTIDVSGAVDNKTLRNNIFNALQLDLLIPAIEKIATEYSEVRVGVDFYAGSLVVVSEVVFLQEDDGSIPLLSEVQQAINTRRQEISNLIRLGSNVWSVVGSTTVTRKALNGLCQMETCGSQQSCVEVGTNNTVCVCLDSSGIEQACGSGQETTEERTTGFTTTPVSTPTTISDDTTTSFPLENDRAVVFQITNTIDVTGAVNDETLRNNIFSALQLDLLIPALAKVAKGYAEVRVGVTYYEGSLVVVSEGVYLQQNDGSIPFVSQVQQVINARRQEIGNIIRLGNDAWNVIGPTTVARKALNGLCQAGTCGNQQSCVEVGTNNTTCVCLSSSGIEQTCGGDEEPTGLSGGAIAGIVIGSVVVIAIVVVVVVLLCRRSQGAKNPKSRDTTRHFSSTSNDAYVYPESVRSTGDPLYEYITNNGPPPPPLPESNKLPILPSNSLTYEEATADEGTTVLQGFRENSEGYMEAVMTEDKPKPEGNITKNAKENDYTEPYVVHGKDNEKKVIEKSVGGVIDSNKENQDFEKPQNAQNSDSEDYLQLNGYEFASPTLKQEDMTIKQLV